MTLRDLFDSWFLKGYAANEGEKLMAAMQHFDGRLRKNGVFKLTRSVRALTGWRRLAPGASRLPLPLVLAEGLALTSAFLQEKVFAIFLCTIYALYLRPSEGLALKGRDVVKAIRVIEGRQVARAPPHGRV